MCDHGFGIGRYEGWDIDKDATTTCTLALEGPRQSSSVQLSLIFDMWRMFMLLRVRLLFYTHAPLSYILLCRHIHLKLHGAVSDIRALQIWPPLVCPCGSSSKSSKFSSSLKPHFTIALAK
jgi:hypothetical protein